MSTHGIHRQTGAKAQAEPKADAKPKTQPRERVLFETRAGDIVLDYRKAGFLPHCETLLVADLHFEKGSYLQAYGHAPLPTYDTADTLDRLKALIQIYRPKRVAALGDSFHDIAAGDRLSAHDFERMNTIVESVDDFIWILGNHDPDIPTGLKGRQEDHMECAGFLLTHLPVEAAGQSAVNICGHLHPKVKLRTRRRNFWKPCFACSDRRIIMPSFGTYTGGLDVSHEAITSELKGEVIYAVVDESEIHVVTGD